MTDEQLKEVAEQLRQPHGEHGILTGKKMNEGNAGIYRYTISEMELKPREVLLEVGMGNGHFVREILEANLTISYTGCDFSTTMVNEASLENAAYVSGGRATFKHCEASQMPLADSSVDKIFTINTIYFWENLTNVFTEFRRVLKANGKLFVAIRPKSLMRNYPFTKFGFTMYEKRDLVKAFEEHGFRVINAVEKQEPDQELAGKLFKVASLIVAGIKK